MDNLKIKNILIIATGGIGNFIMFTPTLSVLMKHFKNAKFYYIINNSAVRRIISNFDRVEKVFFWEENRCKLFINLIPKLLHIRFDIAILAYNTWITKNFFVWLLRARIRVGHRISSKRLRIKNSKIFLSHAITIDVNTMHEAEINLQLLTCLGISINNKNVDLLFPLKKQDFIFAEKFVKTACLNKDTPILAIHAGSNKYQEFKRWPAGYYAELADLFIERFNAVILIFEGYDDGNIGEIIISNMIHKDNVLLCKQLKLSIVGALLKKCQFIVSNDSALSHIASAVQTPVFTIIGPTNEKRTAPWGYQSLAIYKKNMACRPCYIDPGQEFYCRNDRKCLINISPLEVFNFIMNHYSKTNFRI